MHKIQNTYKIVSNEKISPKFYRLRFDAKSMLADTQPGQFIHIRVTDGIEPFFRRPFSVHRAKKYIGIFYEVLGKGTQALAGKKKGGSLDVLGPLGNKFCIPPKGTKQVVMIAGAIGVAPFLILSDFLKNKKYELILLYGGRTRGHVFNMKEYKKNGCKVYVSTDDGSVGVKGKVSKLFSKINKDSATTYIYTCGPDPMMRSVQEFAGKYNIQGEASCEAIMACGLGACLGCSKKTTSGYKTVCYDGPVFNLNEVIF